MVPTIDKYVHEAHFLGMCWRANPNTFPKSGTIVIIE
jgi:hypothetical protein